MRIAQEVEQHLHDPAGVRLDRRAGGIAPVSTRIPRPLGGSPLTNRSTASCTSGSSPGSEAAEGRTGPSPSGGRAGPGATACRGGSNRPTEDRRVRTRLRRSNSALPRITDSGPRISWMIPASRRPTWTSCWLSMAMLDIWRK